MEQLAKNAMARDQLTMEKRNANLAKGRGTAPARRPINPSVARLTLSLNAIQTKGLDLLVADGRYGKDRSEVVTRQIDQCLQSLHSTLLLTT